MFCELSTKRIEIKANTIFYFVDCMTCAVFKNVLNNRKRFPDYKIGNSK